MLAWLSANGATIVVSLIVVAVVVLIIRGMVRDKKAGKSSCGGGCASCPSHGMCHSGGEAEKHG